MPPKSTAKPPAPRPLAKKSGTKKNQKRGDAPKPLKISVAQKKADNQQRLSNLALQLASGVNYDAAEESSPEEKRSHKKKAISASTIATPLAVYRFVGKKYGADIHDALALEAKETTVPQKRKRGEEKVSWSKVSKEMDGVSSHKMAKTLYLRHVAFKAPVVEAEPWGDNDHRCRFLDNKRIRELYAMAQAQVGGIEMFNWARWEVEINNARLRMVQEDGKPNVTLTTLNDFSPKPDDRTIGAFIAWIAPETQPAAPIASGRAVAKDEARNMITLAAVTRAEFVGTAPDCILSTDMFTVFISENGEISIVYMVSGSLTALKEHNLKACLAADVQGIKATAKGRASIPAYATFSATGEVMSIVLMFIDSNIPVPQKSKGYYSIYPIDGTGSRGKAAVLHSKVFVAMLPLHFNECVVLHQMWSMIILPKTAKLCEDLASGVSDFGSIGSPSQSRSRSRPPTRNSSAASSSSSTAAAARSSPARAAVIDDSIEDAYQQGSNAAAQARITARVRIESPSPSKSQTLHGILRLEHAVHRSQFLSPIHCMDGDCPQIAVLMDKDKMAELGLTCIQDLCKRKYPKLRWRFIKFAAGCSMIQSPNDVGRVHSSVKAQTGVKADFRAKDWNPSAEEQDANIRLFNSIVMRQGLGKAVDKTREHAIMGYISNSRKIYSRAFNAVNCCQGWKLAGLCPWNAEIIMSKWSGWAALDPEHAQQILSQIDELAEIIRKDGRIDDAALSMRFPFLPEPHVDHLAAKSWVRDRAVVISCEGYGSARAAAEPEKTAAKAAAKEKAAAARASAPVALVKYSVLADHVAKNIVVAQCQLRHIRFKASDKVEALRQLWKAYDENAEKIGLVLRPVPAAVAPAAASTFLRPRSASPPPFVGAAAIRHESPRPLQQARAGGGGAAAAVLPARSYWENGVYHSFLNLRSLSPPGQPGGGVRR